MTVTERQAVAFAVMAQHNGTSEVLLRKAMGFSAKEIHELRARFADLQRRTEQFGDALEHGWVIIRGERVLFGNARYVRSADGGTGADGEQPAGKRCPRCCQVLPRDRFSLNRSMTDGLRTYCRACMSTWLKTYRDNTPGQRERERVWQRNYRAERKAAREAAEAAS
jgi:hypothetical protein